MTGPTQPAFCSLCCCEHFLDVACDPVERAAMADVRNQAMAEVLEAARARPRQIPRPMTDDEAMDRLYHDEGYVLTSGGWR